uniref:Proteasome subunit alpha type-3 n=1 Tax=Knipowitschia caucasica TaxID=637954 RepID=A0AAV2JJH0_KNICA
MSSIGTGYDLSASTFSPDGRVFQVEYAMKAVENSSTAIAIRCKDGVVFGVEKLVLSKLYEQGSNKRIFNIDRHVGMAVAGLLADARSLAEVARDEASNFRSNYGHDIPLKHLSERVAMYVHAYTLYSAVRPFGCSFILGSFDKDDGPQLYMVDPSGISYGYWGCAIGKAKQAAKTEIEKLQMKDLTCRELVKEVAKIIYIVHDEVKDKAFELELSWVGEVTNGRHELVPKDLREEAEKYAKDSLEEEDDSDEDNICFICGEYIKLSSTAISSWTPSNNNNMKAVEEPAYLTVGTDVSAKYRGAFCEAKIKTVKRLVKVKVNLKGEGTSQVVQDDQVKGQLRVGSVVEVKTNEGANSEAVISKLTDASLYTVVFDDGDEKTLRRTSLCLKGERHFAESETLDQLPLTNPEHFGTPVIGKKTNRGRRSSQAVADEENESSSSSEEEEEDRRVTDELLGTVCSVDPDLVLVLSSVCNEELVVKKDHCLVRSFGDGKFSTVPRRTLHALNSASICKPEHASRKGVAAAQAFLRTRDIPEAWKMDLSQILETSSDSDEKHSGEEEEEEEEEERRKKRIVEEPEEEADPEERDNFLQQLYKFMEDRGTPINKPPVLGYKDLNLFKLFRLVTLQGGCKAIESGTVWKQIYMDLGIPILNSAAAYNVKTAYKKYLIGFEEFCRSALITFRTIHHNNPRPPPSPANQRAPSDTKTSPPANHRTPPEAKISPPSNQRVVGVELKEIVKTETETDSESECEERHTSPRGRRRCVLPLKDKRGTDSDEQRDKRTPRLSDQSERPPRLTDQSECRGRLSDQSERGSEDEEEDDEEEDDDTPHQPTERSEEDPDGVTGTRVRVKYGRGKTQKIYEAHIKKTDLDNGENMYLVHYYGWNVRYDEWVKADRIIWPSEKGSKKKRRGRLKNKEDGPPEEDRLPPMRGSGARRGRPLGSKNKANGRTPDRREGGPNMSNGDTPRRRTRRTSGMYDSDRASNEDSGNSSDDSESEDSTEKKPFPWRRQEADPKPEGDLCLKQEEEEQSESCDVMPESAPEPGETTTPSIHQDTPPGQPEPEARLEVLPVSPEKPATPPSLLLESSPRLKLLSSHMSLPPRSEPMVILHHCLPPDFDTDSASETDSEEEDKRPEESKEEQRKEEEPEECKLMNNKAPLRDLNSRSPQKPPLTSSIQSPVRDRNASGEKSVRLDLSEIVKSPVRTDKTLPQTAFQSPQLCLPQDQNLDANTLTEELLEGERTPERLVKSPPQNSPRRDRNQLENSNSSPRRDRNQPVNSPRRDRIQFENSPRRDRNPLQNSPRRDRIQPENLPKQDGNTPVNSPRRERVQVESSPRRERNAAEEPPRGDCVHLENSLKLEESKEQRVEKTEKSEQEKSPQKRKAPEQRSPEKKLKTEVSLNVANAEQECTALQDESKTEDATVAKCEEAKGAEAEECEQTVPEMGPEALVCHEVDLDEPDEREKVVNASQQLLLMMQLPPTPVKAPPTAVKGLTSPPTNCSEERKHRNTERRHEETSSSPTSNSSNCERGQKRVLEEHHSPSVKKHKRHKRPTPQKHEKNGAGHSSDSEDQTRVTIKTHKHCLSPTSRGHKWTLHIDDLEKMTSSDRISFLQDKLQEIRKYYLSLKSEVASIDRRRKRLKKKEREVSNTASASSSSDAGMSPSSSSPSQSSLAVEVR